METHDHDPTADQPRDPWNVFQEDFGGLGDRLKATYRRVASEDGPSEEEIKDALGTLLGVWDQVEDSVSSALKDPQVREKLKAAASSLAAAVGATIAELGTELTSSGRWRPTTPDHGSGEEE